MDLEFFLDVIGRFRLLVAGFFLFGCLLAILSVATINTSHGLGLKWRQAEQWQASGRLLLTAPPLRNASSATAAGQSAINAYVAVQQSLPGYASLYASFVQSGAVLKNVEKPGGVQGAVLGTPVDANPGGGGGYLPMISIEALSDTPEHAILLGNRAVAALARYVAAQQARQGVPSSQRIQLQVVNAPGDGPKSLTLVKPHSKKLPLAILFVVLLAGVGLAFVLENLRPRVRLAPIEGGLYDRVPTAAERTSSAS